jgi:hypothetical protein
MRQIIDNIFGEIETVKSFQISSGLVTKQCEKRVPNHQKIPIWHCADSFLFN